MTAKDAIKIGLVAGAVIYTMEVGIRSAIILVERHRFVNDNEYRKRLYREHPGRYWQLNRKYSK